jgi:uncharacterized protein (TIGR02996 family)
MTDTDITFLAAVCDRPFDAYPKRVYADWLGDHHRPAEEAFWRWAADAGREPHGPNSPSHIPSEECWDWWSDRSKTHTPTDKEYGPSTIPGDFFHAMPWNGPFPPLYRVENSKTMNYREFPTKQAAWTALRDAWVEVEWPLLQESEV